MIYHNKFAKFNILNGQNDGSCKYQILKNYKCNPNLNFYIYEILVKHIIFILYKIIVFWVLFFKFFYFYCIMSYKKT